MNIDESQKNFIENEPDEIDLRIVFQTIIRNRNLIAIFCFLSVVISSALALSTKRVWQGDFSIVVSEAGKTKSANDLASVLGLGGGSQSPLETQIEILKSPSVLMNVFEFVKDKKSSRDPSYKEMKFHEWKKDNLKIDLISNTSVLNLFYRDTDKELILPVLDKISSEYQLYSGKKRRKKIESALIYYKDQININSEKTNQSLKKFQEFSNKYNIMQLVSEKGSVDFQLDKDFTNIEKTRVEATKTIKEIEDISSTVDSLDSWQALIDYASVIPYIKSSNIYSRISILHEEYILSRSIFKENDPRIISIKNRLGQLNKELKIQIKNRLKASKSYAETRLKASERPDGVLTKYKQLRNNLDRNQTTLKGLEKQFRTLSLEKARVEDPWELITKPTLLNSPLAPRRKRIVGIGLLFGFILGSAVSIIYDKRKNLIFSIDELKRLVDWTILLNLSKKDEKDWESHLSILASLAIFENSDTTALFKAGKIDPTKLEILKNFFKKKHPNKNLIVPTNLFDSNKYSSVLIVASLGSINRTELIQTKNDLTLMKKKVYGIIIIDQSQDTTDINLIKLYKQFNNQVKTFYNFINSYRNK